MVCKIKEYNNLECLMNNLKNKKYNNVWGYGI